MTGEVLTLIKRHEGLRLKPYICPAGYPTIGYGHRIDSLDHPPITREQAEVFLWADAQTAEAAAMKLCPNLWEFPVQPRRLAALTDLVFNVGWGALDGSNPNDPLDDSRVVKALRAGDWMQAAAEFRKWCHARDPETKQMEVLPGLKARRDEGARWIEEG